MVFNAELKAYKSEITDFIYDETEKRCILLADSIKKNTLKAIKSKYNSWKFKQLAPKDILSSLQEILHYNSTAKKETIESSLKLKKMLIINYKLDSLNKSKKTLFGYALKGRGKGKGVLQEAKGKPLGRSSIIVPYENTPELIEFLNYWSVPYERMEVLMK